MATKSTYLAAAADAVPEGSTVSLDPAAFTCSLVALPEVNTSCIEG